MWLYACEVLALFRIIFCFPCIVLMEIVTNAPFVNLRFDTAYTRRVVTGNDGTNWDFC